MTPREARPYVGIDLAGSPRRRTGFCRLSLPLRVETSVLRPDEEILRAVRASPVEVVAIDAPLSLPRGRMSLERPGPPHFRVCDMELRRRGLRFFPLTLGPMRMLTARGIRLTRILRGEGYRVIETYPGAAQDMLGWPRKQAGEARLRRALALFGVSGLPATGRITHDELDAVTAALVARWEARGEALHIGDPSEGEIVLPPEPDTRV